MSLLQNIGKKSRGGAEPSQNKNTAEMATVVMPPPSHVYIQVKQHIGVSTEPIVSVGQHVLVGQVIGKTSAFMSSAIHASVSGTVVDIGNIKKPDGTDALAIVIKSDFQQKKFCQDEKIKISSKEDLVEAALKSGVVGLGGAGFPTHIKYNPPKNTEIDYILVNGAECEPFITSDYREIIENPDDIISGLKLLKKYLNVKNIYIAIEKNKPMAIEILSEKVKDLEGFLVVPLRAQYPQGAEKMLVLECTKRTVPEGKLPLDVGCIVTNVTTVATVFRYIETSQPLTHRRVTVDGNCINNKNNVLVPIGTPTKDIIKFCGGFKELPERLIFGGPMMGRDLSFDDYPITKTDNAILAFDKKQANLGKQTNCIRCSRCADACPLSLLPLSFERSYDARNAKLLRDLKVQLCMECGTCSYVCPARRDLVGKIRLGKVYATQALRQTGGDK